jgi:crotonobetainyl-CoA:carnitine CoA-transferase CaiB-like acyl-CoA transferase
MAKKVLGRDENRLALTDILTGLYAQRSAYWQALNQREQSGLGQHIDVALLDACGPPANQA